MSIERELFWSIGATFQLFRYVSVIHGIFIELFLYTVL